MATAICMNIYQAMSIKGDARKLNKTPIDWIVCSDIERSSRVLSARYLPVRLKKPNIVKKIK
jgi:hypothetical protein